MDEATSRGSILAAGKRTCRSSDVRDSLFGIKWVALAEESAAEAPQTMTAILPGSKWSCLLQRIVLQDALSEVTKIDPPLELRVFVDDNRTIEGKKKKWRKWQRK